MKEKSYKGHSMYENNTCPYKNIYQENSFQIHLQFLHAILEVAYPQTLTEPNIKEFHNHALMSQSGAPKFHL